MHNSRWIAFRTFSLRRMTEVNIIFSLFYCGIFSAPQSTFSTLFGRVSGLLCCFETCWSYSQIVGVLHLPNVKRDLVGNKLLILNNLKIIKCNIKYSTFCFVCNTSHVRNLAIYIINWKTFLKTCVQVRKNVCVFEYIYIIPVFL